MASRLVVDSALCKEVQTLSYDGATTVNGKGHLTRATNGAGAWTYAEYDNHGYLRDVELKGSSNWTLPASKRIGFRGRLAYNLAGGLVHAQVDGKDASGSEVTLGIFGYQYDARGRLQVVGSEDNFVLAKYVKSISHDASGRMTGAVLADGGLVASWVFDGFTDEIQQIDYQANGVTLARMDISGRDKNGNIGKEIRTQGTASVSKAYEYDGFDRLVSAPALWNGQPVVDAYSYTLGGDLVQGATTSSGRELYKYQDASVAHAVTGVTVGWGAR